LKYIYTNRFSFLTNHVCFYLFVNILIYINVNIFGFQSSQIFDFFFPNWIKFYVAYCYTFFFICLIGHEINNLSNKTKIMSKENTNLIISDGPLHEKNLDTAENNTISGNITLIKTYMEDIYCVRY